MNLPDRDSLGRLFDGSKFKAKLDRIGRWVNARAGRKSPKKSPATKTPEQSPSPVKTPAETPPTTETPAAADATASETPPPPAPTTEAAPSFADIEAAAAPSAATLETDLSTAQAELAAGSTPTAETIIGILQTLLVLIGEEEGILTDSEKILLRPSLQRVLKKYDVGADVLPAEVELLVAVAGLVVSRLKKPKTARFAAKMRAWVVNMWFGHKGREIQRVVTREAA